MTAMAGAGYREEEAPGEFYYYILIRKLVFSFVKIPLFDKRLCFLRVKNIRCSLTMTLVLTVSYRGRFSDANT